MPRTYPRIAFSLYAMTIKPDASLAFSALHALGNVADLITNEVTTKPIITYEPDFWLLDGGYKFRPTDDADAHIGIMSTVQSDATGIFSVAPTLTITFGSVQSSDGLTLRFAPYSNDFANDIDVAYYNASNVLIRTDSYTPTSWDFSIAQAVSNFKKIIITFNSTNNPYRYLRLSGIDFGELTYFESTNIKSASVIQEIKPISDELPIGKLELSLFSNDAAFNIINPTGTYAQLKENQPIDVYEFVNTELIYIGRYYIKSWENTSDNEIKFVAEDILSILETKKYYGGIWGAGQTGGGADQAPTILIEDLLDEILTANSIPYSLDSILEGTEINGWLPIGSIKKALQQIGFAAGAYISCSRSGIVKITKTILASDLLVFDYAISRSQKGLSQSLTLKPQVTGVVITTHGYFCDTSPETPDTLFNEWMPAGTKTIFFDRPVLASSIGAYGGSATVTEQNINYAVISRATDGVAVITGYYYKDSIGEVSVYNPTASDYQKILTINNATLITNENGETIAQHLYDYYQQRYLQKFRLFATDVQVGKSMLIDIFQNSQLGGFVEKMNINLTGGFLQDTEIVGIVVE